jgi:hypothetical protein
MSILVWYTSTPLMLLLLYLLVKQRAYRTFPWFFAYVVFGVATSGARLVLHKWPHLYYVGYWSTDAGYWLLGILAMYEVFRVVLEELAGRWARLVFPTVLIAGFALSLARAHAFPPRASGIRFYAVVAEIAVRFVQVFAVLLTFIPLFGHRGHRRALGIAAGFGLYSTVELLNTMKLSDFGTRFEFWWGVTQQAAYHSAAVIWIWFFRIPQEGPSPTLEQPGPCDQVAERRPGRVKREEVVHLPTKAWALPHRVRSN